MKRTLLVLLVVFSCTAFFAQTNIEERSKGTVSKSGRQILPQAGDFSIGIDATPTLKYLGNFLNHSTNNEPNAFFSSPANDQTVFLKYFLKDEHALRARLNIAVNSKKSPNAMLPTEAKTGTSTDEVVHNFSRFLTQTYGLDLAYEMRRGYGRLQGFFGPQLGAAYRGESTTYSYGNAINEKNKADERTLLRSQGNYRFGLGGFVGVEYFVLPKISIAGEVNCNVNLTLIGQNKFSFERWDSTANKQVMRNVQSGGGRNIDSETLYAATLYVNFYF